MLKRTTLVLTGVAETMSGNTYKVVFTNESNNCGAEAILTVNATEEASFNYDAVSYCVDVTTDPTPVISGVAGGTFTSTAARLSITALMHTPIAKKTP